MPDDPTDVLPDPNNPDQFPPPHWGDDPTVFGLPTSLVENATGPAVSATDPMPPEEHPLASVQFPPEHWYSLGEPQTLGDPKIDKPVPTDEHGNVVGAAAPIPDDYGTAAPGAIGGPLPSEVDAANEATQATKDREERDKARDASVNLSPQELALRQLQAQKARDDEKARLDAEASHANLLKAQNDLADLRTAQLLAQADSDKLDADAKTIANTKIDPEHWRDSRTVGQSIAGFIAAVAGGMNAANTGGRNLGLDAMQKHIDDDVAAQTANLANQWKGIGEQRGSIAKTEARAGDLYRAQETLRLANWEDAKNQIATEMTKYDPKGAVFYGYAQSMQDITAKQEAIKIKAAEQFRKDRLEDEKAKREELLAHNTVTHDQRADANASWATSISAKGQALRDREYNDQHAPIPVEQLKQMYPGLKNYPTVPTSRADFEKAQEIQAKSAEAAGKGAETEAKASGRIVRDPRTGEPLLTADGKPATMGDEKLAGELNDQVGAASNFMAAAGAARRMLAKDPSLVSREEFARITTNLEVAKFALIEAHAMKPSSREMSAVEDMIGSNFESYVDRATKKGVSLAQLDTLIGVVKNETATKLRKTGYNGALPLEDSSKLPDAADTSTDTLQGALLREQAEKPSVFNPVGAQQNMAKMSPLDMAWYARHEHINAGLEDSDIDKLADKAAKKGDKRLRRAIDLEMRPSTLEAFDMLSDQLKDPSTRDAAIEALQTATTEAPDVSVSNYAAKLLADDQQNQTKQTETESATSSRSTK